MNFALSIIGTQLIVLFLSLGCGQFSTKTQESHNHIPSIPPDLDLVQKKLIQDQVKDSDNDGVIDSEDNCPRTPAGSKVFTKQDVNSGRVSTKFIGCAANGDVVVPIGSEQNPPTQPIENPPSNPEPNQEKSISELTIGSKIKFRNEFVIQQKQIGFYVENLLPKNAYTYNQDFVGYCFFIAKDEEIIGSKITPDSIWEVTKILYVPGSIVARDPEKAWAVTSFNWSSVKIEIESTVSKIQAAIGCVSEDRGYSRREVPELLSGDGTFPPLPVGGKSYVVANSIWSKDITLDFFQRAVSVELAPKPEAPVIE